MMSAVNVPMSDIAKNITVEITITGMIRYRIRMWLGGHILRFGVWVIGCKSDIRIAP